MIIEDDDLKNELAKMHENHTERLERLNIYIRDFGGTALQADLTEELSEEMEIVTDDLSDDEIIRRLRNGEKVISKRLQVLVENVEIPELVQIFEEDLEDEDVYINTLKNYL
jgi:NAD-specific glutamate dehydrogenase